MKQFFQQHIKNNLYAAVTYNILMMLAIFMLLRVAFFLVNLSYFSDMTLLRFLTIAYGGIQFDISAIFYTNLLYLLMMIIPFRFRHNRHYQSTAKWIFIITNSIAVLANCADMVYFKFVSHRTTASIFTEFANETNVTKVVLHGLAEYWYVSLLFFAVVFLLYKLYYQPKHQIKVENFGLCRFSIRPLSYYLSGTLAFVLLMVVIVSGLRGGWLWDSFVRPITLSNANTYVEKPIETSIVLNTPFCIYRTLGRHHLQNPHYFAEEELPTIYSPVHTPTAESKFKPLNIVVFILEGFSAEFVGELNKHLDNGRYEGYTPFLDSLIRNGLTYEYSFASGRKSIDAMPAVLSGIPAFYEHYVLTPYAASNNIASVAGELDKKGYYTAFFHGAPNGSMGFEAFANSSGFRHYFGLNEYSGDKIKDYDDTWAIWDEEFFQFFADEMGNFPEPFMATLFSASSHDPFAVPKKHAKRFPEEGKHKILKTIRYTDYSLRRFFEKAATQDWFANTLFVFTADHTNALQRAEYLNDVGTFRVPIIFYQPDSDLRGYIKDIAQQTDIMPTILGYLNYDQPFISFGNNLFDPNYKERYAINFNNQIFRYFKDNYVFMFDGQKMVAVYDFVADVFLKDNLLGQLPEQQTAAEKHIKAIIQQYVERLTKNRLVVE